MAPNPFLGFEFNETDRTWYCVRCGRELGCGHSRKAHLMSILDYVAAHRKAIIAAVAAVLVLIVDQETADKIVGALGVLFTLIVPNDQGAVDRIYHR